MVDDTIKHRFRRPHISITFCVLFWSTHSWLAKCLRVVRFDVTHTSTAPWPRVSPCCDILSSHSALPPEVLYILPVPYSLREYIFEESFLRLPTIEVLFATLFGTLTQTHLASRPAPVGPFMTSTTLSLAYLPIHGRHINISAPIPTLIDAVLNLFLCFPRSYDNPEP